MESRKSMKWRIAAAMVLGVAAYSGAASASVLDLDQPNLNSGLGLFDTGGARPLVGQSFIPNLPLLTQVNVNILQVGSVGANTTFTVDIFAAGGSPDGQAPTGVSLGSKTVSIGDLDFSTTDTWDTFIFDAPIALTAGNTYFIQVAMEDPDASGETFLTVGQAVTNPYANGANLVNEGDWGYHDGNVNRDMQFQTFGDIPEPASAVLCSAGGLMLLSRRCRRRANIG